MRIENAVDGTIHAPRSDLRALVGTFDDQSWNPGRSLTYSFAMMGQQRQQGVDNDEHQ